MAFTAPPASRPSLINCVCSVFTLDLATCSIVLNSVLNSFPKVLVEPAAYLKYCPIENLFFSSDVVNAWVALCTVVKDAPNFLVALIELTKFLDMFSEIAALAADPEARRPWWNSDICRCKFLILDKALVVSMFMSMLDWISAIH